MNPPPLPSELQARRSPRGLWTAIILLSIALAVSLAAHRAPRQWRRVSETLPQDEHPQFAETHSYGRGTVKAVRIPVQGVIVRTTESGWFGISIDMTETIIQQIRAAQNDDEVRGILLEVDSPGGAITPVDEIAQALKEFRNSRPDRRVVAFVRDLAASGGYYVAARSDRIVAAPTAMIGSISVILQSLNWHGLSERIGITDITIKSGQNKDLLNPFQPVPDEHRVMLQRTVDHLHDRFLNIVREGRGLDDSALTSLADGSVFSALDARERGLVDEIGYWEQAVRELAECLDVAQIRLVRYQQKRNIWDILLNVKHPLSLPGAWSRNGPTLWALWNP